MARPLFATLWSQRAVADGPAAWSACVSFARTLLITQRMLLLLLLLLLRSVILFDEVEKAHKEVFSVLLSVLDDGRLTDAKGRTVSFANTVIIMTSNLGAEQLLTMQQAGVDRTLIKESVLAQVRVNMGRG